MRKLLTSLRSVGYGPGAVTSQGFGGGPGYGSSQGFPGPGGGASGYGGSQSQSAYNDTYGPGAGNEGAGGYGNQDYGTLSSLHPVWILLKWLSLLLLGWYDIVLDWAVRKTHNECRGRRLWGLWRGRRCRGRVRWRV